MITVEEGKSFETTSTSSRACSSTAAISRPHFVTDPERMEVDPEKPLILMYEEKISNADQADPAAEEDGQGQQGRC